METCVDNACAVLVSSGKVLAVSRKGRPSQLGLPGGKLHIGECSSDACARELLEETGVRATMMRQLLLHNRTVAYLVSEWFGAPYPVEPGTIVGWVSPEDMVRMSAPEFVEYNYKAMCALGFNMGELAAYARHAELGDQNPGDQELVDNIERGLLRSLSEFYASSAVAARNSAARAVMRAPEMRIRSQEERDLERALDNHELECMYRTSETTYERDSLGDRYEVEPASYCGCDYDPKARRKLERKWKEESKAAAARRMEEESDMDMARDTTYESVMLRKAIRDALMHDGAVARIRALRDTSDMLCSLAEDGGAGPGVRGAAMELVKRMHIT